MTRLYIYAFTVLMWIALAALCAFPTLHTLGLTAGGGPVRQWIVNQLLAPMLPRPMADVAIASFNNGAVNTEWLLAVGTLIPYVAALVPILFGIAYVTHRVKRATYDPLLN
jgi:hypothetical protein